MKKPVIFLKLIWAIHLDKTVNIVYNISIDYIIKVVNEMTDKQLRYINRLTVFVRKLLKLVPQEKRDELEKEFDSILLEVTENTENK